MPKKLTLIFLAILLTVIFAWPFLAKAQAQNPGNLDLIQQQQNSLNQIGEKSGYGSAQPNIQSTLISQKIGQIISYILAFLGVVFLVIVVFSGIQWMTAGGNEEKVTKARTRLINATIGLAIVMAAYAITWFVVDKLQSSVSLTAAPQSMPLSCSVLNTEILCMQYNNYHCVWETTTCVLNLNTINDCNSFLQNDCQAFSTICVWNAETNSCEWAVSG